MTKKLDFKVLPSILDYIFLLEQNTDKNEYPKNQGATTDIYNGSVAVRDGYFWIEITPQFLKTYFNPLDLKVLESLPEARGGYYFKTPFKSSQALTMPARPGAPMGAGDPTAVNSEDSRRALATLLVLYLYQLSQIADYQSPTERAIVPAIYMMQLSNFFDTVSVGGSLLGPIDFLKSFFTKGDGSAITEPMTISPGAIWTIEDAADNALAKTYKVSTGETVTLQPMNNILRKAQIVCGYFFDQKYVPTLDRMTTRFIQDKKSSFRNVFNTAGVPSSIYYHYFMHDHLFLNPDEITEENVHPFFYVLLNIEPDETPPIGYTQIRSTDFYHMFFNYPLSTVTSAPPLIPSEEDIAYTTLLTSTVSLKGWTFWDVDDSSYADFQKAFKKDILRVLKTQATQVVRKVDSNPVGLFSAIPICPFSKYIAPFGAPYGAMHPQFLFGSANQGASDPWGNSEPGTYIPYYEVPTHDGNSAYERFFDGSTARIMMNLDTVSTLPANLSSPSLAKDVVAFFQQTPSQPKNPQVVQKPQLAQTLKEQG